MPLTALGVVWLPKMSKRQKQRALGTWMWVPESVGLNLAPLLTERWPWTSHLIALCLSFLICKMEMKEVWKSQSLSRVQFFATPWTSLSGTSVHGILQARILEWVAIPFSRGSSQPRDQTQVSCISGRFFTIWPPGKPICNGLNSYFSKEDMWVADKHMKAHSTSLGK